MWAAVMDELTYGRVEYIHRIFLISLELPLLTWNFNRRREAREY